MSELVLLSDEVQELLKGSFKDELKVWFAGSELVGELVDYGPWGVVLKHGKRELVIPAIHLQAFQLTQKATSAAAKARAAKKAVPLDTGSGQPQRAVQKAVPVTKRPGPYDFLDK